MKAFVKDTDTEIVGTLENLAARGDISEFYLKPDGSLGYKFSGNTNVFWDGQVTVQREGKRVFLTEDGDEYTEDQIELR